jgi:hypothetical protein
MSEYIVGVESDFSLDQFANALDAFKGIKVQKRLDQLSMLVVDVELWYVVDFLNDVRKLKGFSYVEASQPMTMC